MANPRHATLTANTVTTLSLDADFSDIEAVNVDGSAEVYFTINGGAPTVGGDGCQVLPAAISGLELPARGGGASGHTVVQLISSGTPKVSVRGW